MTSEQPREAYVWIWLPGASEPVVAGRLETGADVINFNYGRGYLAREDAIALYLPELPLRPGRIQPPSGLTVAGVIADATPDAWGQRVIMRRLMGTGGDGADPASLGRLKYLLQGSSDRIGALDFQGSPDVYVARGWEDASLQELMQAAQRVEEGIPFSPALDEALLHGSSIAERHGIASFVAEVLPENRAMLGVFQDGFCAQVALHEGVESVELATSSWRVARERFEGVPAARFAETAAAPPDDRRRSAA